MTTGQGQANVYEAANDFSAAKFAAMKAAELGTCRYLISVCCSMWHVIIRMLI